MKFGQCMSRASRSSIAAALAVVFVAAAGVSSAAGTYKWIDDQGVVHYTDHMPVDSVGKGATVLDKQGRAVKKIDPAPTAEQRQAIEAEQEKQLALTKAQEVKARKDRALTLSFSSEAEIDVARGRAISTIEGQQKTIESYIADLTRRQQDLVKRKTALGSKPVPPALDNELDSVTDEIGRQNGILNQKKEERVTVAAKYDADKQRWREIKEDQQRSAEQERAAAQQAAATRSKTAPGATTTR